MQNKSFENEITDLPKYLHQAVLDPHLNVEVLNQICDASTYFNFAGLCTSLIRIPIARKRLGSNKKTNLIAVVGFPFGDIPYQLKQDQAEWAAEKGADELDVVPNFLELHEGHPEAVADELSRICEIGLPTRVIIDAKKLNKSSLKLVVEASIDAGVRSIQTGNGFGPKMSCEEIQTLSQLIKGRCSIKAAGGIKDLLETLNLIKSGCSFIGTSIGPELIKEFRRLNQ